MSIGTFEGHLRLGKTPARPDAVKFKLSKYIDKKALPKPPGKFGHEDVFAKKAWGMLGNDNYGDCVWAGAAHETMLLNKVVGKTVNFTAASVLSDYTAATGFDPHDPSTDNGTDMKDAASYRRKTGVVDAQGNRHKVEAYLALKPGSLDELFYATYLFGCCGVGIEFPNSAMDQFNAGKPWDVVARSKVDGGHYIPVFAKRTNIICVTWAQQQPMTARFFQKYSDEAIAYVSSEFIQNNKSPEGFDLQSLLADLQQVASV